MHFSHAASRRTPLLLTALVATLLTACKTPPKPPVTEQAPVAVAAPPAPPPTPAPLPKPVPDPHAQFKQLRAALPGTTVTVEETVDGRIRISLPSDLSFAPGKVDVRPNMGPVLDQIADSLNRFTDTRAEIVGYTDNSGNPAKNLALSFERAVSTLDELVKRKVVPGRLSFRGMGQNEPVADNKTLKGRSANRRIDIFVIKR